MRRRLHGLGFLFWLAVIGVALFTPRESLADEDTVAVPRMQLAALQVEHARMRAMIEDQQEKMLRMAEVASMCLANFPTAGFQ